MTASVTFAQRLQRAWLTRGPLAIALLPVALLYGAVTGLRRLLYGVGVLRAQALPASVIVVGNLIVGGAGKTPTVIAIVALLRRQGYAPGIVSRGYGGNYGRNDSVRQGGLLEVTREAPASVCGDEPLLLHLRTGAPVLVGRNRVDAARELLRLHPQIDVIVSDDGLQHLALARDAQVIVFDERGAGNGWWLPAGPLREAVPRVLPKRSLVVYNTSRASTPLPGTLAQRALAGVVPLADWWCGAASDPALLDALRGRLPLAAAGLAQPERFFAMLRERGLTFTPLALPDHYDYAALPWPADTADVVLTEKDASKLNPSRIGATRVWVAPLDFALDAAFEAALIALLAPPGSRHGNTPA